MKTVLLILLWCIIVGQQHISYGQSVPFDNYTLENGLAHSNVLRLFQDSKGYLWLGTQYGVSRFNGEHFVNYTASDGLPGNTVMSMNELSDGSLLIGTHRGGLSMLRQGRIVPYPTVNAVPQGILYASTDRLGRIWLINKGGANGNTWECGYLDHRKYHPILLHQYLGEDKPFNIYRVEVLADSSVVLATERGAFIVSATGGISLLSPGLTCPLYIVVQDRQGVLWFGADDKLCRLQRGQAHEDIPLEGSGVVNVMTTTRDGGIWWYARERGLFCLKDGTITDYTAAFSLNALIVNELLEDSEGSLWIGTYNRGVYRIGDSRMKTYTVNSGLAGNYVSAVTEDESGRIWVGSMGGISLIENDRCAPVPSNALNKDDIVNALLVVDGECWATSPFRMVKISVRNRTSKRIQMGCVSLYRTPTAVYVGGYRGYMSAPPELRPINDDAVLTYRRINSMLREPSGAFWFATDSGLYVKQGTTVRHFGSAAGFRAKEAYSLCRDSSGTIWCATDNGLYFYNGTLNVLTVADGLSHNRCSFVLCDRTGALWIGTLRGVNRFYRDKFTWYNAYKGLAGDEVNTLFLDSRNRLWIGTVNGLTQFDIERNHTFIQRPPVYITMINVDDRPLTSSAAVEIGAYEHTVHFQFRAIQLGKYREVLYRYKLVGSGDAWQTTRETAVRYSSLPPGSYTFVVQAALAEDEWAYAQSAQYAFTVATPFWQSWWFIGSCCVVLALLVVLVVRIRETLFRRRQAEKLSVYSRMLNLRQQALTALVNPHFVFNSLNSIQFFINRSNKELANEYLANFADLIRRTMEDSQCVVVPLRDELSRLELYLELEALRFANRFRYTVSVDPELDLEETLIPVMLIQPYVENAIWHGLMPKDGRGEVRVIIKKMHESRLNIIVEDNGIGIEEGKKKRRSSHHVSRGMQIMQERLELISKMANEPIVISVRELMDDTGQPGGTRVELELPLDLEHITTGVAVLE